MADAVAADPASFSATANSVTSALIDLRNECKDRPDDVLIVYIAGHGVQLSKHDAIVLLHDFAAGHHLRELGGAVDAIGCHRGFDGDAYPSHQFWFVDACRQPPAVARRFETLEGAAISLDEPNGKAESTPVFLASSTREAAFAEVSGTSLFSQALLWALRGAGATGPDGFCSEWNVRTSTLIDVLGPRVALLASSYDADQHVDVTGRPGPGAVHRFAEAPPCDLRISVAPVEAQTATTASLTHGDSNLEYPLTTTWPLTARVPAGLYLLNVVSAAPYSGRLKPLPVVPPETDFEVGVGS